MSIRIEQHAMQRAADIWPRLARAAGLGIDDYALSPLSVRQEGAGGARVVVLVEGAERFVIKFRLNARIDTIDTTHQAHRAAAKSLADVPDCAAPRLSARDAETGALLLGWIPGPTLLQAIADKPDSIAAGLAHAGRWMAALHLGNQRDTVPFGGDWMLRRLDRMMVDDVAEPDTFAACRAALGRLAEDARGTKMQRAVIHGDLTTRNLMWDRQVMTGIDFENTDLHPVARDAAMLLCDVAVRCKSPHEPVADGLLAPSEMDAFVRGLGEDAVPDLVLRFFIGLNLLQRWARISDRRSTWSLRRAHVFGRVSLAAPRVLKMTL